MPTKQANRPISPFSRSKIKEKIIANMSPMTIEKLTFLISRLERKSLFLVGT
ncbi:MAG: hypothetical protein GY774_29175 [Planctomycetes bacterium]|nr:hypothetical protein [Planctomycetota bacterium]